MKRAGFTMIELIFVIVILGILAAVALPKFAGVAEEAHDSKVKAFAGTLNRTVGPALWSKSISAGNAGSVSAYCATIAQYTDVPDELTDGGSCAFTPTAGKGATLGVAFTSDGNATNSPVWTAQ